MKQLFAILGISVFIMIGLLFYMQVNVEEIKIQSRQDKAILGFVFLFDSFLVLLSVALIGLRLVTKKVSGGAFDDSQH